MKTNILRRASRGFTLVEIMLTLALVGMGAYIGVSSFRGSRENGAANIARSNAENLMKWVSHYRTSTGNAIDSTGFDSAADITITRANHILDIIDGDIGNGEVIIESGYQFPSNATFPAGFKETAAGVFTPIPVGS